MELTLSAYIKGVREGTLSPDEVYAAYMERSKNDVCNAYVTLTPEANSWFLQNHGREQDRKHSALAGAPLAIKDNILTKWYRTTCASKMLESFVAPYDASCYNRLVQGWARMIGKANMDEYAMWSSSENSAFWPVLHPLDHSRIPWWSSGGSTVAVAADLCLGALGTDTWGSIRLPAALCGVVGFKPTYGRISRYGVVAMASSLDQVWTLTKTIEDAAILLEVMSGHDKLDATSSKRPAKEIEDWYTSLLQSDVKDMRIAVPYEFFWEGLDPKIDSMLRNVMDQLKARGAKIDRIHLPVLQTGIPVYYILMPAEVTTNLARFDGIRFGTQDDTSAYATISEYYKHVRDEWFGDEVKRRIITWNYVLSAGYYDAYYRKAQLVRQKLIHELENIYRDYDIILWPTSPTVARKIGEKTADPVQMYLMDVYTVIANLAGIPAVSLPIGTINTEGVDLPVGIQLMAKQRNESALFKLGNVIEKLPKIAA